MAKSKPLNLWQSLALVLVPAGAFAALIHFVIPAIVEQRGIPFLYAYLPWWIAFMTLWFVASLVAYRLEGRPWSWRAFAQRYRLRRIQGRDWLWLLALLATLVVSGLVITLLGPRLASLPGLRMPAVFPVELDPSNPGGLVAGVFMGAELQGRWWIPLVYFIGWVLNIAGEEFWFRGYILPRQELAYGRWAWAVHALIWGLNHIWQKWTLVILLPFALPWAYIAQRSKNTSISIIAHGVVNFIPVVTIIAGVLG